MCEAERAGLEMRLEGGGPGTPACFSPAEQLWEPRTALRGPHFQARGTSGPCFPHPHIRPRPRAEALFQKQYSYHGGRKPANREGEAGGVMMLRGKKQSQDRRGCLRRERAQPISLGFLFCKSESSTVSENGRVIKLFTDTGLTCHRPDCVSR